MPCTITVTTKAALALYPSASQLKVQVGKINRQGIEEFVLHEGIVAVVDASHPYAAAISTGAIAAANQAKIPYLRYERAHIRDSETKHGAKVIELNSFDTLLTDNYLQGQRVLLTIGYRALPLFQSWQEHATLFARLLPHLNSLEVALAAGFTPDRLIALRPPISAALETALWRQWRISLVVTKASGTTGGEDVKRLVAAELGIPLIVISRPTVAYPRQTSNLSEVLRFCREHMLTIDKS